MRLGFLYQQCLCGMIAVNAAERVGWGNLEFGREVHDDLSNAEIDIRYRDLIESEILFMSMSMSFDYNKVSPTPAPSVTRQPTTELATTIAPVLPEADVTRAGCDEQVQSAVDVKLEVDTAIGKTELSDDLVRSLKNALSADYSFCSSRRLGERILEDRTFLLGGINIITANESCSPQSTIANNCYVVFAEFFVSGEGDEYIASNRLRASLDSIFEYDQAFDDELLASGIVDVRLEETTGENALNAAARSGKMQPPARPAVVAVLSIAAGTVVAAAMLLHRFGLGSATEESVAEKQEIDSEASSSGEETVAITNTFGSIMV